MLLCKNFLWPKSWKSLLEIKEGNLRQGGVRGEIIPQVSAFREGVRTMLVFVITGAIAGILLGVRFKVLVLVPACLVAAVVIIVNGSGHTLSSIVLTVLGTVVSLQIGYIVGSSPLRAQALF
jgi:hypothetical protein